MQYLELWFDPTTLRIAFLSRGVRAVARFGIHLDAVSLLACAAAFDLEGRDNLRFWLRLGFGLRCSCKSLNIAVRALRFDRLLAAALFVAEPCCLIVAVARGRPGLETVDLVALAWSRSRLASHGRLWWLWRRRSSWGGGRAGLNHLSIVSPYEEEKFD